MTPSPAHPRPQRRQGCLALSASLLLALAGAPAHAGHELAVCSALYGSSNPNYHGIITTRTRLRCVAETRDGDAPGLVTVPELIAQGWQLVKMVGGNTSLLDSGQHTPPPLYYFEREIADPVEPAATSDGFFNFF